MCQHTTVWTMGDVFCDLNLTTTFWQHPENLKTKAKVELHSRGDNFF